MHACLPPGLRAALVLMSLACVAATRMIAQQMPTADQYVGYTNGRAELVEAGRLQIDNASYPARAITCILTDRIAARRCVRVIANREVVRLLFGHP